VYRIAQEALRNVIAHAAANHVDVDVRHNADHVDISVTDDGRGFERPSHPKPPRVSALSVSANEPGSQEAPSAF
jgi:signal transduction histidine kinase